MYEVGLYYQITLLTKFNTTHMILYQFNFNSIYFILQHNINEYKFAKALTKFDIIIKIFSYKAMTLEYSTHVKLDKAWIISCEEWRDPLKSNSL